MIKIEILSPELDNNSIDSVLGQCRSLRQRRNASCGYYSLHNGLLFLLMIYGDEDTRKFIAHNYHSREFFFKHMENMLSSLLSHSKEIDEDVREFWPWRHNDIMGGCLERNYMEYFLAHHPWVKLVESSNSKIGIMSLSDFGIYNLKNNGLPLNTLRKLSSIFDNFKNLDSYAYEFLFGVTNHWITLVVNKVNGFIETIIIDSRNMYTLETSDEEMIEKLHERIAKSGKVVQPYLLELYIQSIKDTKYLANLFHQCATSQIDLLEELVELNITGFFESYDNSIQPYTDPEEYKSKLNMWFDNYFPPPVLQKQVGKILSDLGVHLLKETKQIRFKNWIKEIETNIDFKKCKEEKVMKRFEKVFNYLKSFFTT